MIYFDRALQDRVLTLFDDSLAKLGVLALGHKETLRYSVLADRYEGARRVREALPEASMSYDLIVIGASWGGLHAIGEVLAARPPTSTCRSRSRSTDERGGGRVAAGRTRYPVEDAEDKQPIERGRIYLAPPTTTC